MNILQKLLMSEKKKLTRQDLKVHTIRCKLDYTVNNRQNFLVPILSESVLKIVIVVDSSTKR